MAHLTAVRCVYPFSLRKSSFGKLAQACFSVVRDLIVTHSPYSLWGRKIALPA